MPCPKGTYQDQEGQQSCLACPDNTYSDKEGSTEYVACTPHCTNCNKTTGVCSACQDGYDLENGICKYNATFKTVKIDGIYWTTKNAGDYDGPQIPDNVNIYYVDSEFVFRVILQQAQLAEVVFQPAIKGQRQEELAAHHLQQDTRDATEHYATGMQLI